MKIIILIAILCCASFVEPVTAQKIKPRPILVQPRPSFNVYKYLSDNLNYPEIAKEANIQGRVLVRFWIDEKGSVEDVQILRGIGGGCDEEVKRVVSKMPRWRPGTFGGKPTKLRYTLPVNFRRG
jgi:protein TonB